MTDLIYTAALISWPVSGLISAYLANESLNRRYPGLPRNSDGMDIFMYAMGIIGGWGTALGVSLWMMTSSRGDRS